MKSILLHSLHFLLPMVLILMVVAPLDDDFRYSFPWFAMTQTADMYLDLPMPAILGFLWPIHLPVYAIYLVWASQRHQLRQSFMVLVLLHLCAIQTNLILRDWADLRDAKMHKTKVIFR